MTRHDDIPVHGDDDQTAVPFHGYGEREVRLEREKDVVHRVEHHRKCTVKTNRFMLNSGMILLEELTEDNLLLQ
jgi:hypothetical protein